MLTHSDERVLADESTQNQTFFRAWFFVFGGGYNSIIGILVLTLLPFNGMADAWWIHPGRRECV
jgi:hypothetical protein